MENWRATTIAAVVLALVVSGCTSGPPKPRKFIGLAKKEARRGNDAEVLRNMEKVVDWQPRILNKSWYADELELYRDSQVRYGLTRAAEAEQKNSLEEAWVWYVQVSQVDPARPECQEAKKAADATKDKIARALADAANAAVARGDVTAALSFAARSKYFGGGDEATKILAAAGTGPEQAGQVSAIDEITEAHVAGLVRTNSLELLNDTPVFAPYGLPIYFGDVPRYYVVIDELMAVGVPAVQRVPSEYAMLDGLASLTTMAREKTPDADAIINVRLFTTANKRFVYGEAVKFANFSSATPEGISAITDLSKRQVAPYPAPSPDEKKAASSKKRRGSSRP